MLPEVHQCDFLAQPQLAQLAAQFEAEMIRSIVSGPVSVT